MKKKIKYLHFFSKISNENLKKVFFNILFKLNDQEKIIFLEKIEEDYFDIKVLKKALKISKKHIKNIDTTFDYGFKYFYGNKILIKKKVFVPQYDTEGLVEIIQNNSNSFKRGLEIGVGTGAILISLMKLGIDMIGVDVSKRAIKQTHKNCFINKLDCNLITKDFFKIKLNEKFDFAVSNPPYISYQEKNLDKWVLKNQPHKALFSKNEGLYFYEKLINSMNSFLKPKGKLFLEIGYLQKEKIEQFLINKKYNFYKDLSNKYRYLEVEND